MNRATPLAIMLLMTACTGAPDDESATSGESTTDGSQPTTEGTEGTQDDCATEPPFWGPATVGECNSLNPFGLVPDISLAAYTAMTATSRAPSGGNLCPNGMRVVWGWFENGFDPGYAVDMAVFFSPEGRVISVRQTSFEVGSLCDGPHYWSGPQIAPTDCDTVPFDVPDLCLSDDTFAHFPCKNYQMDTVYPPVP